MAYRRKGGITKAATFKDELMHHGHHSDDDDDDDRNQNDRVLMNKKGNETENGGSTSTSTTATSTSLAARATRASAAHRDSSGYAYAYASSPDHSRSLSFPKGGSWSASAESQWTSGDDNDNDVRYGFWGVLARKAKSILEDEPAPPRDNQNLKSHNTTAPPSANQHQRLSSDRDSAAKLDNARLRKRLDAITSSLNNFGDSLGNAFEEGRTLMEHKTADIIQETRTRTADFIQETRKLHLRRRGPSSDPPDQPTVLQNTSWQRPVAPPVQTNSLDNQQTQLKASRDVAMATAAKAKLLLRELKTVKADLAFAKERCSQLEEENKRLRENREKGDNPADDDLIRLQLETLLAEKARLAHENSIYARENRFLREIVEYHQLTMQDVVYLDEGAEEVTEVYPFPTDEAKMLSSTPTSPISPGFLPEGSSVNWPLDKKEHTREVTIDVLSAPPNVCPTNSSPERIEASKVPASSQEKTEDTCHADLIHKNLQEDLLFSL